MDEVEITEEEVRRARHGYYGAIAYVDDHVGELIATLRTFGLEGQTIVLFTSDHGDMLGERGLWYKMCFFEWAARVPLIVAAPTRFAPRRSAAPVSHLDLLPTLLELGAREPGWSTDLACDGASLVPCLDGRPSKDRPVLAEYLAEGALAPIFMIRRGRHKFIWSEPDPPMLFDMENNPDELLNLAERPEQVELVRAFEAEVREHWDPVGLRAAIVQIQRTRRYAFEALSQGRRTSWDYRPVGHGRYVGGDVDLTDLERTRRFPPPEREQA